MHAFIAHIGKQGFSLRIADVLLFHGPAFPVTAPYAFKIVAGVALLSAQDLGLQSAGHTLQQVVFQGFLHFVFHNQLSRK